MINILLVIFAISLLYMGIANRLTTYINILALQGILLFGVSFIELIQINTINLIFILFETIVFKTIVIPIFLKNVIKKNNIMRETEPFLTYFMSIVIITSIIFGSFILSNVIDVVHFRKMMLVIITIDIK